MSKRRLTLLIIACFVGLLTVVVARSMMTQQQPVEAPQVKTTEILAATRDLSTGTILKETDMKWIPWPAESDTSQYYLKGRDEQSKLGGAVLRDGMRNGEPFITGHVVQPRDHGFLAVVLEPGKRAMSVTLTPSANVAGFVFPGDHVDVILTHGFSRKDNADLTERRVSETVLSDVRVLALDQKSDSLTTEPKIATLATLEVTPKQAEKLALAADLAGNAASSSHGSLSLVLRSLTTDDNAPLLDAAGHAIPLPPKSTTTWDSDVSPAFPGVNGDDSLVHRVHIMRGKDAVDTNFERHR